MSYYSLIKPLLFSIDPERAHHLSFALANTFKALIPQKHFDHPLNLAGLNLPNPIGLAAGLDKNGEYLDVLSRFGFGFLEVGTVTPRAQVGNPKPRLFRLTEDQAIINRMGFNNKGVDYLLSQVSQSNYTGVLGINIGKNFDTPIEKAVDDYVIGLQKASEAASYIAVNISSPNTENLRDLQGEAYLSHLIETLQLKRSQLAHPKPIFIKVAPDLSDAEIEMMADVFLRYQVDAVIATNTVVNKPALKSQFASEKGGLSGRPIHTRSLAVVSKFKTLLKGQVPIIGVGGIDSGQSADEMFQAGADAIQLYTGLIYKGMPLVSEVAASLVSNS